MTRRYFSGSTLEQAVMSAARHYGVEVEELAYRQIEKKHGFLRTRRAALIAVDPEQPQHAAGAPREATPATRTETRPARAALVPEPRPADGAREKSKLERETVPASEEPSRVELEDDEDDDEFEDGGFEDTEPAATERSRDEHSPEAAAEGGNGEKGEIDEELLEAAERASQLLLRFAGIDAKATASSGAERIEVEIEGPDDSVLVVEGGKGLLSVQHLLPRLLRGLTGRSSYVRVDCDGFHQQRRERLEALALKEAEAVSRTGSARTLPPMAPDERRLVHLALKESPMVVTESRGSGLHKRVVIRPVDGDGGSDDIEARHGF